MILTQLIHVFECKSERRTLLHIPFFNNLKLIGAVCVSLAVMSFAIWHPVGQMIFETVALSAQQMRLIGLLLLAAPLLWAVVSGRPLCQKGAGDALPGAKHPEHPLQKGAQNGPDLIFM